MKKILIVEDDEVERELVRLTLERAGYLVVAAEDAGRGYDLAGAERPDLIVTDFWMPGEDGARFVRRVRETAELSATPILVVTGFGGGGAALALSGGADAYEPKPLDPDALLQAVARLLA